MAAPAHEAVVERAAAPRMREAEGRFDPPIYASEGRSASAVRATPVPHAIAGRPSAINRIFAGSRPSRRTRSVPGTPLEAHSTEGEDRGPVGGSRSRGLPMRAIPLSSSSSMGPEPSSSDPDPCGILRRVGSPTSSPTGSGSFPAGMRRWRSPRSRKSALSPKVVSADGRRRDELLHAASHRRQAWLLPGAYSFEIG